MRIGRLSMCLILLTVGCAGTPSEDEYEVTDEANDGKTDDAGVPFRRGVVHRLQLQQSGPIDALTVDEGSDRATFVASGVAVEGHAQFLIKRKKHTLFKKERWVKLLDGNGATVFEDRWDWDADGYVHLGDSLLRPMWYGALSEALFAPLAGDLTEHAVLVEGKQPGRLQRIAYTSSPGGYVNVNSLDFVHDGFGAKWWYGPELKQVVEFPCSQLLVGDDKARSGDCVVDIGGTPFAPTYAFTFTDRTNSTFSRVWPMRVERAFASIVRYNDNSDGIIIYPYRTVALDGAFSIDELSVTYDRVEVRD